MKRATAIAVAACLAVLAALTLGTVQIVRRERAATIDQFTAERLHAITALAREIDKDFESIGKVLRIAGELYVTASSTSERQQELGAIVTVVKPYLLVSIYDAAGRRAFEAVAPGVGPEPLYGEMDAAARRALTLPPDQIDASPPFSVDGAAWYRVFARWVPAPDGERWAVVLLVDTEPLFAKVRLIVTDTDSRLLVLGAHGQPAPASSPEIADHLDDPGRPQLRRVAELMRAGGSGTMRVDETEAAAVGLAGADAVAAYAPIPFRGGHWSLATLSSTAPLRAHDRAIVLRLGIGGGAIAVCLVLFATYAVVATRRSSAMRERLAHAARLAHLHELTEKILDNVPAGVLALSSDGRITRVNRTLRARLAAEPIGGDLGRAFPDAPPPVLEQLRALVDAALATGSVQSRHGELVPLFGREGQYSLHAVPLEPGFPEAHVLLVVEDLSEVRALESNLLRAEKLATVGVLAAGIAHEIGTPLGVVRGRAEYLLGKLPDDSKHGAGVRVIIDEIDRVTRVIRQLLDFARVKPVLARAAALAPIVTAVAELLRYEAERREVAILASVADSLPLLGADPDQLQQVLVNLVMNACDACAPGGHVTVSARADERAARIEIADDGCGIPEELRHQVFDPFFTTKKRGQGTGLGLAVAAQVVRNHGGEIELLSAVGAGTRVTVVWPLAGEGRMEASRGAVG